MSRSSSREGGFEPGCKFAASCPWDPDAVYDEICECTANCDKNTFVTTETKKGTDTWESQEQIVTLTLEYNPSTGNATYYIASPSAPNGNTYFSYSVNIGKQYTSGLNVKYSNDTYDHMYADGNPKITYSQMNWTDVKVKKSNGT